MYSARKIAIGTAQFGLPYGISNKHGQTDRKEAEKILAHGYAAGIDTIDTAIAYGESETILGAIGIDHFKVVTKLPRIAPGSTGVRSRLISQIEGSLARLKIGSLYGLLLHDPSDLLGEYAEPLMRALSDIRCDRLVRKIGFSLYDVDSIEQLCRVFKPDIVQLPLNVIDRRFYMSGWLERLHSDGVEVHTRSTFLQGLLLMREQELPKYFNPWRGLWRVWHNRLTSRGVNATAACLSYPIAINSVSRVLVGVESERQLEHILCDLDDLPQSTDWNFMTRDDTRLISPINWKRP